MNKKNDQGTVPVSAAEQLAVQLAEITANAKQRARSHIEAAMTELFESREAYARAATRAVMAAKTVRELKIIIASEMPFGAPSRGRDVAELTPAELLAKQIAEATADAKLRAESEIEAAKTELKLATPAFAQAELDLGWAARTVREYQDILGDVKHDDLVLTQEEVDDYNLDERCDPMVFGYSINSNPEPADD